MVNNVLALLNIDVKSLISAANITDNITPFKPSAKQSEGSVKNTFLLYHFTKHLQDHLSNNINNVSCVLSWLTGYLQQVPSTRVGHCVATVMTFITANNYMVAIVAQLYLSENS